MLLIDSPVMWSLGPVDWSHCNEHIAWPRSHSIPPFLPQPTKHFFHLTAGEIVRSCRAYKISPKKCIAILSICIHSQGTQRKLQINYYSRDYLVLLSNWPGTHSIAFNWLKKNHPGCPTNLLQPNIFDYGNEMKCGSHRRPSFPFSY